MTLSSERVKHLEFIQSTISRQATNSFTIKGWSLTVAGLIYAFAAENLSWWLAVVALLPPVAFAWLDLFYLRQERLFRALYRSAYQPESTVQEFDMDTTAYQQLPNCSYRNVATSRAWWPLHVMIAAVGIVLLIVAVF